jgi:hypothetical protein
MKAASPRRSYPLPHLSRNCAYPCSGRGARSLEPHAYRPRKAETRSSQPFTYHNNAAHQTLVGVGIYCSNGQILHWGKVPPTTPSGHRAVRCTPSAVKLRSAQGVRRVAAAKIEAGCSSLSRSLRKGGELPGPAQGATAPKLRPAPAVWRSR